MPAAPIHGKKSSFSLNSVDLSNWFNDIDFPETIDTAETTGFQPAGDVKTWVIGLKTFTITLAGFWDPTIDGDIASIESGGVSVPWIYGPGGAATGAVKITGNALLTKNEIKGGVAAPVTLNVELQVTGAVTRSVF